MASLFEVQFYVADHLFATHYLSRIRVASSVANQIAAFMIERE